MPGEWSGWSSWSDCHVTGDGCFKSRENICDNIEHEIDGVVRLRQPWEREPCEGEIDYGYDEEHKECECGAIETLG